MSSVKFGTSGLRGLVVDLTDALCFNYTRAFMQCMRSGGRLGAQAKLLVACDLRDSSPGIAAAVMAAARREGVEAIHCGIVPTPALALQAMRIGAAAVMITGSHIPADRNGLKFYRPDGEIDKADEAAISGAYAALSAEAADMPVHGNEDGDARRHYAQRYTQLGAETLQGLRIGVYQHSSVARDMLVEILSSLGAETVSLGRTSHFVPVDTEAVSESARGLMSGWVREHRLAAIVSTDGDADRPMLVDEQGTIVRGDVIGILTARFLKADAVVTPVTSTSAVEQSGFFATVVRTRVGSPYVIEGMAAQSAARVVGFEANGGFLVGSPIAISETVLSPLPTRDAVLPMVATLAAARAAGVAVSTLVGQLPQRRTASGLLSPVEAHASAAFLARCAEPDTAIAAALFDGRRAADTNTLDGVKFADANGDTVHFRASGNAPEFRCYTEAADQSAADALLERGLGVAREGLGL